MTKGIGMRGIRRFKGMVMAATVAGCLLCLHAPIAFAQDVVLDTALIPKKPKAGPPDVKAQPTVWPRLDPGAVLCRTEDDLLRLAANRSGGAGGGPADCRIISQPTGISILKRQGPGRVMVQVSGRQDTGWTDAWLPEKAPAATRASGR